MKKKNKGKTVQKTRLVVRNAYSINNPSQMSAMAIILKQHILKNNLYTNIAGKNYVHVEGWQFAGGLLGTLPRVKSVENISTEQEVKWKAEVEIVNVATGNIISTGFAVCSNKEAKKKSFDEYAILSMAQTRAIGKAYRNVIGWVIKLAGYEATPSEEMVKIGMTQDVTQALVPTAQSANGGQITEKEAEELLRVAISKGFTSKAKFIAGVSRLLKIKIKNLTSLTKSQANTVLVELLRKGK